MSEPRPNEERASVKPNHLIKEKEMLEVKTFKQMSAEELKGRLRDLEEQFEGMEYGSYEYDCADADLQSITEILRQRAS